MPLFSKYSGAGNDFVIVRAEEIGLRDAGALAIRACSRRTGVGVDGLILVRSVTDEIVRVRFFNPDGGEFGTCGNGSRCAARYAVDRGLTGPELVLVTDDGEILARVEGGRVSLDFSLDPRILRELRVPLGGGERRAWLVEMGTPHLVVPVEDVEIEDFEALARPLRSMEALGEEGANVDLVDTTEDPLPVRTFERGVEGETLACGSGCMAVAYALRESGRAEGPVAVRTRSGETLDIEFLHEGRIRLSGSARHIFDGVLPDEPA